MASSTLFRVFRSQHQTISTSITCITRCMSSDLGAQKIAARKAASAALRKLSPEQMAQESAAISDHLHGTGLVHDARRMAIYVHCAKLREVDTTAVLSEALDRGDARVYVPRVQDKDANMHFLHIASMNELHQVPPFGIREPNTDYLDGTLREDANEMDAPLDLVVMPGLAFTKQGLRLGRGGGYYDKFIERCNERALERGWPAPLLVAIAFRAQFFDEVPCDAHDQPVDLLVTADGVLYCSERGKEVEKNLKNSQE